MKTTSRRSIPATAKASSTQSNIGRPMTGTSAFGISSVLVPRRLPRPAPITIAFMACLVRQKALSLFARAELSQHVEILQRGDVALRFAARGHVFQQTSH